MLTTNSDQESASFLKPRANISKLHQEQNLYYLRPRRLGLRAHKHEAAKRVLIRCCLSTLCQQLWLTSAAPFGTINTIECLKVFNS